MEKFQKHSGQTVAIDRPNIDTDQIIPKQFLKRIERTGYGEFLFYDWRFDSAGSCTGSSPIFKELLRKMSPKLGAMTTSNP